MNDRGKRAPRADGQRNKSKLLEAAWRIAVKGGEEIYLDHVAKEAGVSIATLYRHFPTREALLLQMSQQDAIHFRDRAAELLGTRPAVDALGAWLQELSCYGLIRPGMARAFRTAANDPVGEEVYRTFVDALDSLLGAGQRERVVRTDLSAEDLVLALCGLWDLKDSPATRAQCARLSGLLLDGLQVR